MTQVTEEKIEATIKTTVDEKVKVESLIDEARRNNDRELLLLYENRLIEKEKQYNEIVKAAKSDEQLSGEAKAEETKGLSYREYKPNEKENQESK